MTVTCKWCIGHTRLPSDALIQLTSRGKVHLISRNRSKKTRCALPVSTLPVSTLQKAPQSEEITFDKYVPLLGKLFIPPVRTSDVAGL